MKKKIYNNTCLVFVFKFVGACSVMTDDGRIFCMKEPGKGCPVLGEIVAGEVVTVFNS